MPKCSGLELFLHLRILSHLGTVYLVTEKISLFSLSWVANWHWQNFHLWKESTLSLLPIYFLLQFVVCKLCISNCYYRETSSNSKSPSSSWQGPPSGTGFRSTPPQGAQSTAPGVPSTSRGYHAAAAAPGGTAPSKPGGFKSASSFGTDRRPSRDGKKTHLEEALSMPSFSGQNVPVCNVDGMPVKLVIASVCHFNRRFMALK